MKILTVILLAHVIFVIQLPFATANEGPKPGIHSFLRCHSTVKFTISLASDTDLSAPDCMFKVTRSSGDGSIEVIPEKVFSTEEAVAVSDPECWDEPEGTNCGVDPGGCSDCDGDGTPDCGGLCYRYLSYQYEDIGVEEGSTTYRLWEDWGGDTVYWQDVDYLTVDVDHDVDECQDAPDGGTPTDPEDADRKSVV